MEVLDSLKNLSKQSRHDLLNYVAVGAYADQAAAMQHNRRRSEAQVDAMMKYKCGDAYKPPDEDDNMSTVIAGNVIADESVLAALIAAQGGSGAAPAPGSVPQQQQPAKKSFMQKALPWVAGAAIGLPAIGATGAAGAYLYNKLNPVEIPEFTDTANEFDLSSPPFDPNQ